MLFVTLLIMAVPVGAMAASQVSGAGQNIAPMNVVPDDNQVKALKQLHGNVSPLSLSPDEYQVKMLDNGSQEVIINNPMKFLESQKISIPKNAKNVRVVIMMKPQNENGDAIKEKESEIAPNAWYHYVIAYGSPFDATDYSKLLGQANGSSGSLTVTITNTYSASYSCDLTVSAGDVSAAVGFDVTKGYWISESNTVETNGIPTTLKAYELDSCQAFQLVNAFNGDVDGWGLATMPIGATFVSYQS